MSARNSNLGFLDLHHTPCSSSMAKRVADVCLDRHHVLFCVGNFLSFPPSSCEVLMSFKKQGRSPVVGDPFELKDPPKGDEKPQPKVEVAAEPKQKDKPNLK